MKSITILLKNRSPYHLPPPARQSGQGRAGFPQHQPVQEQVCSQGFDSGGWDRYHVLPGLGLDKPGICIAFLGARGHKVVSPLLLLHPTKPSPMYQLKPMASKVRMFPASPAAAARAELWRTWCTASAPCCRAYPCLAEGARAVWSGCPSSSSTAPALPLTPSLSAAGAWTAWTLSRSSYLQSSQPGRKNTTRSPTASMSPVASTR